jgi:hypothetical protein
MKRCPVFLGAIVLSGLLAGCRGDRYDEDGEAGTDLGAERDSKFIILPGAVPLPETLKCGTIYTIFSDALVNVPTCDGINFKTLYERVLATAMARVNQLKCPAQCSPLKHWIMSREWKCNAMVNAAQAYVSVRVGVLCPEPGQPVPMGLGSPLESSFAQKPHSESDVNPSGAPDPGIHETIQEAMAYAKAAEPMDCPGEQFLELVMKTDVPECGQNMKSFADEAEARAKWVHDSVLQCKPGCKKNKYATIWLSWKCITKLNQSYVEIRLHWGFRCDKS